MQDNGATKSQFISERLRVSSDSGQPLESSPVVNLDTGLILQLADGTVQACNAAAEQILGAISQQIQDDTATKFPWRTIREDGFPFLHEMHPATIALQTGQPCSNVVMGVYKADGELIWLLVHAQPLFQPKGAQPQGAQTQASQAQNPVDRSTASPYAAIVTFTDITVQKQQAEHLDLKNTPLKPSAPASDLAALDSPSSPRRVAQHQLESNSSQVVLCVDDNETNLYITSRLLQEANFTVWQARTGSRALELANEQPDLIILDVKLPDISGIEVCQRLKANPATASIPVLHLSAERITSQDKIEGLERGADGYLIQPIDSEELLATARSLLRLRSAEQVLRRSQERLHRMVETAQIGIAFVQPDGEILEANAALLRMLGYLPEEIREQGINWNNLIALDQDKDHVLDNELGNLSGNNSGNSPDNNLGNIAQRSVVPPQVVPPQTEQPQQQHQQWDRFEPVEKDLICKDGRRIPVLISGTQLPGEANEQVTFVVDLSDRKRIEAALQHRTDELSHANHIKDEFLAVLSHELRSPLNPILGWCRLLQSRKFDPEKTAEALATIERNAKLQTQLIDDLLDVSRILRGKLSLNVMSVDLVYIVKAAIETVRLAAEAKSIQFEKVFEPVGLVTGDAARLQQVVWNLLFNAVKFTPAGNRISIYLTQQGTHAQIQVIDTGRGISPDFLPYVFDYFRQADSTTTRKFGGLGLGLAIVRQIVELHGGTVQADSLGEGQGATFTVRLPISTASSTAISQAPASAEMLNLSGVKVIVVDDEPDSREFVAFVLEQSGAQVTALSSAVEVLQALSSVKPDVLVSDIGMPEVDGYTLIRQIRMLPSQQDDSAASSKEISSIPAIALTAYAGETNQQQALAAGFQWHLAKPIVPDELVEVVAELAHQSSARGA